MLLVPKLLFGNGPSSKLRFVWAETIGYEGLSGGAAEPKRSFEDSDVPKQEQVGRVEASRPPRVGRPPPPGAPRPAPPPLLSPPFFPPGFARPRPSPWKSA